jgi:hypothetical protein
LEFNAAFQYESGFPDLIVPAGMTWSGLPVTISFFGQAFSEGQLLGYGYDFEQATKARVLPKHTPALPSDVLGMAAAGKRRKRAARVWDEREPSFILWGALEEATAPSSFETPGRAARARSGRELPRQIASALVPARHGRLVPSPNFSAHWGDEPAS